MTNPVKLHSVKLELNFSWKALKPYSLVIYYGLADMCVTGEKGKDLEQEAKLIYLPVFISLGRTQWCLGHSSGSVLRDYFFTVLRETMVILEIQTGVNSIQNKDFTPCTISLAPGNEAYSLIQQEA